MKREKVAVTIKALEDFYYHRVLTEFLKALSEEELYDAKRMIEVNDIDEVKAEILGTINQEMEYRADQVQNASSRAK